jgi:hypothetical protein
MSAAFICLDPAKSVFQVHGVDAQSGGIRSRNRHLIRSSSRSNP